MEATMKVRIDQIGDSGVVRIPGDDVLLDEPLPTDFDRTGWRW